VTRGSEVQILSPRPFKISAHFINLQANPFLLLELIAHSDAPVAALVATGAWALNNPYADARPKPLHWGTILGEMV